MGQVHYEEVETRSALNRVGNMGFHWSLNPYRGCVLVAVTASPVASTPSMIWTPAQTLLA